jgi:hypothetical protein
LSLGLEAAAAALAAAALAAAAAAAAGPVHDHPAPNHALHSSATALQFDPQGSWLLDGSRSKRIAVHMRRGDVTSLTTKRALPTSFYLNVVKQVIQVRPHRYLEACWLQ